MALTDQLRHAINWMSAPPRFFTLTVLAFLAVVFPGELGPPWLRRITRPLLAIYRPRVGGTIFAVIGLLFALSCFDPNFILIVGKPDNVPIAAMVLLVYLLGRRLAAG